MSPCFLHALAEGMHTMAQPLTVLRATLEIAAGNASSVSHFQRAVDTSLAEVSRVSEAMRFVQELLRIARDESPGSPVELREVVEIVREDLACVLEASSVSLCVEIADDVPAVRVSAIRLRQSLFYLVQHAAKTCQPGETVRLQEEDASEMVRLTIRVETKDNRSPEELSHHELPWGGTRPCVVLAEALLNLDGGELNWEDQPFTARLKLPTANKDEKSKKQISGGLKSARDDEKKGLVRHG
jgi:hypothetical protein